MSFMEQLKTNLDDNTFSVTENGAKGYATSGKELLDFFFKVSSYRKMTDADIAQDFHSVYAENAENAVKLMFFIRDCRGGLGERRLFRICFIEMSKSNPTLARKLLAVIPEYGRWDDLIYILENTFNSEIKSDIYDLIVKQLSEDMINCMAKKPISLLAKWLPSINTSSKAAVNMAYDIAGNMKISPKNYRKTLSKLRAYLKIVECDMSGNNWGEIDYNAVPSNANLKYKNAFLKHDTVRRQEYLRALASGDKNTKINASALYPYEIVHKYAKSLNLNYWHWNNSYNNSDASVDIALEEMWKALPVPEVFKNKNVICVCDGSGSMDSLIGAGDTDAHCVANSIAIMFSEHLTGPYKDKFITFSSRPQFVDLSGCSTLFDKVKETYAHTECSNTDIYNVFKLILDTAVKNNLEQKDIPEVLIVSDMEFDIGASFETTLFDEIKAEYASCGFSLPKLNFWNVCSRTNTVPVRQNKFGFSLVSGFSQTIFDMVLSDETDPYKILMSKLNCERYAKIAEIIAEKQ